MLPVNKSFNSAYIIHFIESGLQSIFDPIYKIVLKEQTGGLDVKMLLVQMHEHQQNVLGEVSEEYKWIFNWSPIKALIYIRDEFNKQCYPISMLDQFMKEPEEIKGIIKAGYCEHPEICIADFLFVQDKPEFNNFTFSEEELKQFEERPIEEWILLMRELKVPMKGEVDEFTTSLQSINNLSYGWDKLKVAKVQEAINPTESTMNSEELSEVFAGNYNLIPSTEAQDSELNQDLIVDNEHFNSLPQQRQYQINHFLKSNHKKLLNNISHNVQVVFSAIDTFNEQSLKSELKSIRYSLYSTNIEAESLNAFSKIKSLRKNYNTTNVLTGMEAIVHGYLPIIHQYSRLIGSKLTYNNNNYLLTIGNYLRKPIQTYKKIQLSSAIQGGNVSDNTTKIREVIKTVYRSIPRVVYINGGDNNKQEKKQPKDNELSEKFNPYNHIVQGSATEQYINSLKKIVDNFNKEYATEYRIISDMLVKIPNMKLEHVNKNAAIIFLNQLEKVMITSAKSTIAISGAFAAKDINEVYIRAVNSLIKSLDELHEDTFSGLIKPLNAIIDACKASKYAYVAARNKYLVSSKSDYELLYRDDITSEIYKPCGLKKSEIRCVRDSIKRIITIFNSRSGDNTRSGTKDILTKYISDISNRNQLIENYFKDMETAVKIPLSKNFGNDLKQIKQLISMKLVWINETKEAYLWLNRILDKFLVQARLDALKQKALTKDEIDTIAIAYIGFSRYYGSIQGIVKQFEDFLKTPEKIVNYFALFRLGRATLENIGGLDFLETIYKKFDIGSDSIDWTTFKPKLYGYLANSLIGLDIYQKYTFKDNGKDIKIFRPVNHDWLRVPINNVLLDGKYTADELAAMNPVEQKDKIFIETIAHDILGLNSIEIIQGVAGAAPINPTLAQCAINDAMKDGKLGDNKFLIGFSMSASPRFNAMTLDNFNNYVIQSMFTPIIQLIDKYIAQRYEGSIDLTTNTNMMLQGGDKFNGASVFDLIDNQTMKNISVYPEAVQFYVSAYVIMNKYGEIYGNNDDVHLRFSKLSGLARLQKCFTSNKFVIVDNFELQVFVSVMNDYWNSVGGEIKDRTIKAIELIINELNGLIVFNKKESYLLSGHNLNEYSEVFVDGLQSLEKSLKELIEKASTSIVSRGLESTVIVDKKFESYMNRIKSCEPTLRFNELRNIILEISENKNSKSGYYGFVDMCISPVYILGSYYDNIMNYMRVTATSEFESYSSEKVFQSLYGYTDTWADMSLAKHNTFLTLVSTFENKELSHIAEHLLTLPNINIRREVLTSWILSFVPVGAVAAVNVPYNGRNYPATGLIGHDDLADEGYRFAITAQKIRRVQIINAGAHGVQSITLAEATEIMTVFYNRLAIVYKDNVQKFMKVMKANAGSLTDFGEILLDVMSRADTLPHSLNELSSTVLKELNKNYNILVDNMMKYPGLNDQAIVRIAESMKNKFKLSIDEQLEKLRTKEDSPLDMKMIIIPSTKLISKIPSINIDKMSILSTTITQDVINEAYPTTYTRYVVESLAVLDNNYFLPLTFVESLMNSPLKNQTFYCLENNFKLTKNNEEHDFTEDFKVDVESSLLISRSRSDIATLRMSSDTMSDAQMNKTLAMIPFLVNILEKCKLLLPNNAVYSICPGSEIHVNAKTEINILLGALKDLYQNYSTCKINNKFMNVGETKLKHFVSEIRLLLDEGYLDYQTLIETPEVFEWICPRAFNNFGLTFKKFDRFDDYKSNFLTAFGDDVFSDSFENTLDVLAKVLSYKLYSGITLIQKTVLSLQTMTRRNESIAMAGGNINNSVADESRIGGFQGGLGEDHQETNPFEIFGIKNDKPFEIYNKDEALKFKKSLTIVDNKVYGIFDGLFNVVVNKQRGEVTETAARVAIPTNIEHGVEMNEETITLKDKVDIRVNVHDIGTKLNTKKVSKNTKGEDTIPLLLDVSNNVPAVLEFDENNAVIQDLGACNPYKYGVPTLMSYMKKYQNLADVQQGSFEQIPKTNSEARLIREQSYIPLMYAQMFGLYIDQIAKDNVKYINEDNGIYVAILQRNLSKFPKPTADPTEIPIGMIVGWLINQSLGFEEWQKCMAPFKHLDKMNDGFINSINAEKFEVVMAATAGIMKCLTFVHVADQDKNVEFFECLVMKYKKEIEEFCNNLFRGKFDYSFTLKEGNTIEGANDVNFGEYMIANEMYYGPHGPNRFFRIKSIGSTFNIEYKFRENVKMNEDIKCYATKVSSLYQLVNKYSCSRGIKQLRIFKDNELENSFNFNVYNGDYCFMATNRAKFELVGFKCVLNYHKILDAKIQSGESRFILIPTPVLLDREVGEDEEIGLAMLKNAGLNIQSSAGVNGYIVDLTQPQPKRIVETQTYNQRMLGNVPDIVKGFLTCKDLYNADGMITENARDNKIEPFRQLNNLTENAIPLRYFEDIKLGMQKLSAVTENSNIEDMVKTEFYKEGAIREMIRTDFVEKFLFTNNMNLNQYLNEATFNTSEQGWSNIFEFVEEYYLNAVAIKINEHFNGDTHIQNVTIDIYLNAVHNVITELLANLKNLSNMPIATRVLGNTNIISLEQHYKHIDNTIANPQSTFREGLVHLVDHDNVLFQYTGKNSVRTYHQQIIKLFKKNPIEGNDTAGRIRYIATSGNKYSGIIVDGKVDNYKYRQFSPKFKMYDIQREERGAKYNNNDYKYQQGNQSESILNLQCNVSRSNYIKLASNHIDNTEDIEAVIPNPVLLDLNTWVTQTTKRSRFIERLNSIIAYALNHMDMGCNVSNDPNGVAGLDNYLQVHPVGVNYIDGGIAQTDNLRKKLRIIVEELDTLNSPIGLGICENARLRIGIAENIDFNHTTPYNDVHSVYLSGDNNTARPYHGGSSYIHRFPFDFANHNDARVPNPAPISPEVNDTTDPTQMSPSQALMWFGKDIDEEASYETMLNNTQGGQIIPALYNILANIDLPVDQTVDGINVNLEAEFLAHALKYHSENNHDVVHDYIDPYGIPTFIYGSVLTDEDAVINGTWSGNAANVNLNYKGRAARVNLYMPNTNNNAIRKVYSNGSQEPNKCSNNWTLINGVLTGPVSGNLDGAGAGIASVYHALKMDLQTWTDLKQLGVYRNPYWALEHKPFSADGHVGIVAGVVAGVVNNENHISSGLFAYGGVIAGKRGSAFAAGAAGAAIQARTAHLGRAGNGVIEHLFANGNIGDTNGFDYAVGIVERMTRRSFSNALILHIIDQVANGNDHIQFKYTAALSNCVADGLHTIKESPTGKIANNEFVIPTEDLLRIAITDENPLFRQWAGNNNGLLGDPNNRIDYEFTGYNIIKPGNANPTELDIIKALAQGKVNIMVVAKALGCQLSQLGNWPDALNAPAANVAQFGLDAGAVNRAGSPFTTQIQQDGGVNNLPHTQRTIGMIEEFFTKLIRAYVIYCANVSGINLQIANMQRVQESYIEKDLQNNMVQLQLVDKFTGHSVDTLTTSGLIYGVHVMQRAINDITEPNYGNNHPNVAKDKRDPNHHLERVFASYHDHRSAKEQMGNNATITIIQHNTGAIDDHFYGLSSINMQDNVGVAAADYVSIPNILPKVTYVHTKSPSIIKKYPFGWYYAARSQGKLSDLAAGIPYMMMINEFYSNDRYAIKYNNKYVNLGLLTNYSFNTSVEYYSCDLEPYEYYATRDIATGNKYNVLKTLKDIEPSHNSVFNNRDLSFMDVFNPSFFIKSGIAITDDDFLNKCIMQAVYTNKGKYVSLLHPMDFVNILSKSTTARELIQATHEHIDDLNYYNNPDSALKLEESEIKLYNGVSLLGSLTNIVTSGAFATLSSAVTSVNVANEPIFAANGLIPVNYASAHIIYGCRVGILMILNKMESTKNNLNIDVTKMDPQIIKARLPIFEYFIKAYIQNMDPTIPVLPQVKFGNVFKTSYGNNNGISNNVALVKFIDYSRRHTGMVSNNPESEARYYVQPYNNNLSLLSMADSANNRDVFGIAVDNLFGFALYHSYLAYNGYNGIGNAPDHAATGYDNRNISDHPELFTDGRDIILRILSVIAGIDNTHYPTIRGVAANTVPAITKHVDINSISPDSFCDQVAKTINAAANASHVNPVFNAIRVRSVLRMFYRYFFQFASTHTNNAIVAINTNILNSSNEVHYPAESGLDHLDVVHVHPHEVCLRYMFYQNVANANGIGLHTAVINGNNINLITYNFIEQASQSFDGITRCNINHIREQLVNYIDHEETTKVINNLTTILLCGLHDILQIEFSQQILSLHKDDIINIVLDTIMGISDYDEVPNEGSNYGYGVDLISGAKLPLRNHIMDITNHNQVSIIPQIRSLDQISSNDGIIAFTMDNINRIGNNISFEHRFVIPSSLFINRCETKFDQLHREDQPNDIGIKLRNNEIHKGLYCYRNTKLNNSIRIRYPQAVALMAKLFELAGCCKLRNVNGSDANLFIDLANEFSINIERNSTVVNLPVQQGIQNKHINGRINGDHNIPFTKSTNNECEKSIDIDLAITKGIHKYLDDVDVFTSEDKLAKSIRSRITELTKYISEYVNGEIFVSSGEDIKNWVIRYSATFKPNQRRTKYDHNGLEAITGLMLNAGNNGKLDKLLTLNGVNADGVGNTPNNNTIDAYINAGSNITGLRLTTGGNANANDVEKHIARTYVPNVHVNTCTFKVQDDGAYVAPAAGVVRKSLYAAKEEFDQYIQSTLVKASDIDILNELYGVTAEEYNTIINQIFTAMIAKLENIQGIAKFDMNLMFKLLFSENDDIHNIPAQSLTIEDGTENVSFVDPTYQIVAGININDIVNRIGAFDRTMTNLITPLSGNPVTKNLNEFKIVLKAMIIDYLKYIVGTNIEVEYKHGVDNGSINRVAAHADIYNAANASTIGFSIGGKQVGIFSPVANKFSRINPHKHRFNWAQLTKSSTTHIGGDAHHAHDSLNDKMGRYVKALYACGVIDNYNTDIVVSESEISRLRSLLFNTLCKNITISGDRDKIATDLEEIISHMDGDKDGFDIAPLGHKFGNDNVMEIYQLDLAVCGQILKYVSTYEEFNKLYAIMMHNITLAQDRIFGDRSIEDIITNYNVPRNAIDSAGNVVIIPASTDAHYKPTILNLFRNYLNTIAINANNGLGNLIYHIESRINGNVSIDCTGIVNQGYANADANNKLLLDGTGFSQGTRSDNNEFGMVQECANWFAEYQKEMLRFVLYAEFGKLKDYNNCGINNRKVPKFASLHNPVIFADFTKHCNDPRFSMALLTLNMHKLINKDSIRAVGIRQFKNAIGLYRTVFEKYCIPGKFNFTPMVKSTEAKLYTRKEYDNIIHRTSEMSEFQQLIKSSIPEFDPVQAIVGNMNFEQPVAMTGGTMIGGLNRLAEVDGEDVLKEYCEQAKALTNVINVDSSKIQDAIVAYYQKPLMSFNAYFNNNSFVEIIYNSMLYRNAIKKIHDNLPEGNRNRYLIDLLLQCMFDGATPISTVQDNIYDGNNHSHRESEYPGNTYKVDIEDTPKTIREFNKEHAYNQIHQFTPNYKFFNNKVRYFEFDDVHNKYADMKEDKEFVKYIKDRLGNNLLDVIVNLDTCDTCIATLANLVKQFSYYDIDSKARIYDTMSYSDTAIDEISKL